MVGYSDLVLAADASPPLRSTPATRGGGGGGGGGERRSSSARRARGPSPTPAPGGGKGGEVGAGGGSEEREWRARMEQAVGDVQRRLDGATMALEGLVSMVFDTREDVRAVIRRLDDADRHIRTAAASAPATTTVNTATAAAATDNTATSAGISASPAEIPLSVQGGANGSPAHSPLAAVAEPAPPHSPALLSGGRSPLRGVAAATAATSTAAGAVAVAGSHISAEMREEQVLESQRLKRRMLKQSMDEEEVSEDDEDRVDVKADPVPLKERVFGICSPDHKLGKEGSRFVHPSSPFATSVMATGGIFLIYSALFVPMQLSFWTNNDPCSIYATTYFDLAVDSFFLLEIFLNFFTGFHEDGVYFDEMSKIAKRYLLTPSLFFFDAITSIPFSYYDLYIYKNCGTVVRTTTSSDGRLIRLIKPLRILKLLRILKTMRVMSRVEDELSYWFGPVVVKMGRLFINLVVSIHFFSCAYWRVKMNSSREDIESFLESKNVDINNTSDIYVMCFYFVFTVFSTVGFGDISATDMEERIFCIVLFLAGSSLFGTMIAQLNDILQTVTRESREMDQHMMGYHTFMNTYRVPRQVENTITQWVRFQFTEEQADRQKREVLSDESLPEEHRLALARSLRHDLFFQIPFLTQIPERIRSMFSAELLLKAECRYYSQETVIGDFSDRANSLMIVAKGYVEMCLPTKEGGGVLRVLRRGDLFGDSHIVGDYRWAGAWGIEADFVAKTMCSVISIRASDLQRIFRRFDFTAIRRRVERGNYFWKLWQEEADAKRLLEEETSKPGDSYMKPKIVCLWIDAARRLLHTTDNARSAHLVKADARRKPLR